MSTILLVTLSVLATLFIILMGWMILGLRKMLKSEKTQQTLNKLFAENYVSSINKTEDRGDDLQHNMDESVNNLYRYIDEKFESFNTHIFQKIEEEDKIKEKNLDRRFYKIYKMYIHPKTAEI